MEQAKRLAHQKRLYEKLFIGVVGKPMFCHTASRAIKNLTGAPQHFVAQLTDGWHKILEQHPNLLILEIDNEDNEMTRGLMRELLEQTRERFGDNITVALALNGVEQLLSAGELLFENQDSHEGSELVDFFITLPTINSQAASIRELLGKVFSLVGRDRERKEKGGIPLPTLNSPSWIQSMGDIRSLELWIKWLPRYAQYIEENPIITGLTGTGKTKISRALHLLSGRKGDFVSMTPRDFSSSELIQAELFGAVAGAYTGAVDKWGLVKSAHQGTLFFDEFQSIDLELQGKLITFIENKAYRRVGSAEITKADVRFVFASNRKLFDLVEQGLVREDFAYRLERVMLELLPLNERPFDIAPAIAFALSKLHRQRTMNRPVTGLTSEAYRLLLRYSWPGNLRQLENLIAKACERVELEDQQLISEDILASLLLTRELTPLESSRPLLRGLSEVMENARNATNHSLPGTVRDLRSKVRKYALEDTHGDIVAASELIDDDEICVRLDNGSES